MTSLRDRAQPALEELMTAGDDCFLPGDGAKPARHALCGRLVVAESAMSLEPAAMAEGRYLGRRIDLFPTCELGFVSHGGDLIPTDRGIQHPLGGESFWDIIVSPGRVWSEPGDGGRSRAAFPFVLSNSFENDAHNGLASFLFDDEGVSDLSVQIVQETAPYLLPGPFDARGEAPAKLRPGLDVDVDTLIAAFARERADEAPLRPWSDLAARCDADLLDAVTEGQGGSTSIVSGLIVDGEIFATPSRTRRGDYPYPRHMRHGSWSMAKSAAATLTMLRLARLYGDEVLEAPVAALLDVSAPHDGWDGVTLGDCLNMATGIGDAQPTPEPVDILADNTTDPASDARYRSWYDRPSARARIDACFALGNYPWGPGEVARYRDPDIFMAGAVMDALYRREAGPGADLWTMMLEEVYAAIGIPHLPMNRTLEADGSAGLALMAFGLFLAMDDVARIARLLHDGGVAGGEQLLSPALLAQAIDPRTPKGLPTGLDTPDGPVTYHLAFWHLPFRANSGALFHLPTMVGYGGNRVLLLPNGMTTFRFAHDDPGADEHYDVLRFARIADAIEPF